jgi:hypothetical protein
MIFHADLGESVGIEKSQTRPITSLSHKNKRKSGSDKKLVAEKMTQIVIILPRRKNPQSGRKR